METFTPELIDKLFQYPALLGVGYVMWNQNKVMIKMLEIIRELKKEKE